MQIRLNGKPIELEPCSLATLLEPYKGRIAVALNEEIAPRATWDSLLLSEGDRVEIIHAVQGG